MAWIRLETLPWARIQARRRPSRPIRHSSDNRPISLQWRGAREGCAAVGLINHYAPLSTSEVGLKYWPGAAQGLWSPLFISYPRPSRSTKTLEDTQTLEKMMSVSYPLPPRPYSTNSLEATQIYQVKRALSSRPPQILEALSMPPQTLGALPRPPQTLEKQRRGH